MKNGKKFPGNIPMSALRAPGVLAGPVILLKVLRATWAPKAQLTDVLPGPCNRLCDSSVPACIFRGPLDACQAV